MIVLGGIGVTPGLSIIQELHQHKLAEELPTGFTVDVIWMIRHPSIMDSTGISAQLENIHDGWLVL